MLRAKQIHIFYFSVFLIQCIRFVFLPAHLHDLKIIQVSMQFFFQSLHSEGNRRLLIRRMAKKKKLPINRQFFVVIC